MSAIMIKLSKTNALQNLFFKRTEIMGDPQQVITPRKRNFLIGTSVILLSVLVLFIVLIGIRVTKKAVEAKKRAEAEARTQAWARAGGRPCKEYIFGKLNYYMDIGKTPCEAIKVGIHEAIGAGSCVACNLQDPRDANWGNYACEPYAGATVPYCR
jgi:hypothetical protein